MTKFLGFGLKFSPNHLNEILTGKHLVDWFEILTEDFIDVSGKSRYMINQLAEQYPLSMHGVSLSIGSTDPLDYSYLQQLKSLAAEIKPKFISDHLCFTGVNGINTHDLLPLPYTFEAIKHIANRIRQVQDYLGRQILIENVSSYLTYTDSAIPEWEFLNEIANQSDCLILLDINNIYVSSYNHKFNPLDYINGISPNRVAEYHIAGHTNYGAYILDTHDAPIIDNVWQLYKTAINHFGLVSTLLERDENIPSLNELNSELNYARQIANG